MAKKYKTGISRRKLLCEVFEVNDSYLGNAISFKLNLEKHERMRNANEYVFQKLIEFENQLKQEVIEKFVEKS